MLVAVSLRGQPVEETATLPDGRAAIVRVGIAQDPYVAASQLDTVTLEVTIDGEHAAGLSTVLDPDQTSEARQLVRQVVAGLESGELEPTAGALEPLAETLR